MRLTCVFTVASETNRVPAISRLDCPSAISRSTSASRGVSSSWSAPAPGPAAAVTGGATPAGPAPAAGPPAGARTAALSTATSSTAASTPAAWPATVMPGSVPSSSARPSRTADWSSATTTVTVSAGAPL